MHPTDGADTRATSWGPRLAQSGVEVVFLAGERRAAERIARRLFRRALTAAEYAGLAGAPRGARVEIGASDGALYLELGDPASAAYRGYYYVRRAASGLVVVNDGFRIARRDLQRRGLGLCVFGRQVAAAAALGIDRIEVVAGRSGDENGYYTWPRFGFEGVLPPDVQRVLPIGLQDAKTVLDVMETERGRAWWREYGVTIRAAFDLAQGSRSRTTFDRYVGTRKKFAIGPKTNLENTRDLS